jgi:hypothetical protein
MEVVLGLLSFDGLACFALLNGFLHPYVSLRCIWEQEGNELRAGNERMEHDLKTNK